MCAVTGIQYFLLFTAFYKKTLKKLPVAAVKKNDSAEDLPEELGETDKRVQRNSSKVVKRGQRNSITHLGKNRKNTMGVLPPIKSNDQPKELEKLSINSATKKIRFQWEK